MLPSTALLHPTCPAQRAALPQRTQQQRTRLAAAAAAAAAPTPHTAAAAAATYLRHGHVGRRAASAPLRRAALLTVRSSAVAAAAASGNGSGGSGSLSVLVIGGGGREHALAWKLAQSELCSALYCAPGNAGIAAEPGITALPDLKVGDHQEVVDFCRSHGVGLVVVGPEAPLVDGLADSLQDAGLPVFGPSAAAAQLEGSKAFMKDLCRKYNIPTAAYAKFTDPEAAKQYIRQQGGGPIVVKTDGLAAGKGVIVAQTLEEAEAAVDAMLVEKAFGSAGAEVVVEEFLDGEEASFFALIDGEEAVAFGSAQDHKAVGDGDTGPNTGGMGAYTPAPVVTPELEEQIMRELVLPTARGMVAEGCPYRGVIFAGVMIKDGKAKLLEHNVRFGDPECQGLMYRMKNDLLPVLLAACTGRLAEASVEWQPGTALTVVMAAAGYPGSYKKGTVIRGLHDVSTAKVFHAGTSLNSDGEVVAVGGRVLGLTALGSDAADAQAKAYRGVKAVQWDDAYYRRDIGWRAVERLGAGTDA